MTMQDQLGSRDTMFSAKIYDSTGFHCANSEPTETIEEQVVGMGEWMEPGYSITITKDSE